MRPEQLFPALVEGPSRTDRDKAEMMYQQALVDVLLDWESVCAPRSRPVTADMIEMYAESLADLRATPDELRAARKSLLLTNTFFPTVAEIAGWLKNNRVSRGYEGWVDALDANGVSVVAPKANVLNGRLVKGGGNGVPAPPMAEYADVIQTIHEVKAELGVRVLADAEPEELEAFNLRPIGPLPQALPVRRESIGREREAELIQQAIDNATRKRESGS